MLRFVGIDILVRFFVDLFVLDFYYMCDFDECLDIVEVVVEVFICDIFD